MGSNDGITESFLVRGRSWPQIYCFLVLWEPESQLQEVKKVHLSSKNGVSSSSWRLKEIWVLEGMLWKGGSLKLDCLSGSAGAVAQWRSSPHLKSTNWRAATPWTWMGTQRHTVRLLQVHLFHPMQVLCLWKQRRMQLMPAFPKHPWHCFVSLRLSH